MAIDRELISILQKFKSDKLPDFLRKYHPEHLVVLEPKGEKDWKAIIVKTQSEVDSSQFYEYVVGTVEEVLQFLSESDAL